MITGASRGIGYAVAEYFLQQGENVILGYQQTKATALALEERFPYNARAIAVDVCDEASVERFYSLGKKTFGMPEVLLNIAGVAHSGLVQDMTIDEWDHVFNTNVRGAFLLSRAALPDMIRKKAGTIINMSSIWGSRGAAYEACYSASKGALESFTKALAKEVAPSGIRVNAVAPGAVATDMWYAYDELDREAILAEIPFKRVATTLEVASLVYFLASEQTAYMTGEIIGMNGGF